jgi:hypothetical protein
VSFVPLGSYQAAARDFVPPASVRATPFAAARCRLCSSGSRSRVDKRVDMCLLSRTTAGAASCMRTLLLCLRWYPDLVRATATIWLLEKQWESDMVGGFLYLGPGKDDGEQRSIRLQQATLPKSG